MDLPKHAGNFLICGRACNMLFMLLKYDIVTRSSASTFLKLDNAKCWSRLEEDIFNSMQFVQLPTFPNQKLELTLGT